VGGGTSCSRGKDGGCVTEEGGRDRWFVEGPKPFGMHGGVVLGLGNQR